MAKNDNRNDVVGYLAQVEQDNQQIQRHTGLPWYKGSKRKYKQGSPKQNSLLAKILLGLAYVILGTFFYLASPSSVTLWIVFGAVFFLMFRDAAKKPKG